MKFAKRVFFWAGVYGMAVLAPQFVMETRIGDFILEFFFLAAYRATPRAEAS